MSVGDCGHGVDLEVLVRSNLRDSLNGTPVCEGRFSIIEPVIAQVLHVVSVEVGYTLGDLAARNAAAKGKNLVANVVHDFSGCLARHKLVVKAVTSSEHFNVVDVVRVDGWKADSAVVHLTGEDLITKKVVSKDTAVRICVVETISKSNVG